MIIGSLFSGIGGLEMGLELAGVGRTVWQVEQSVFCRGVLSRHWPNAERFLDVKKVGKRNLRKIDLICGGFPCQDISSAGKGAGLAGSRSGLWFEYSRIIEELKPRWVVIENVASGASKWVDAVSADLERNGYESLPIPISAADVGAPHLRRRIFIVAYTHGQRLRDESRGIGGPRGQSSPLAGIDGEAWNAANSIDNGCGQGKCRGSSEKHDSTTNDGRVRNSSNPDSGGESAFAGDGEMAFMQEPSEHGRWSQWPSFSPICGVDDGVPAGVVRSGWTRRDELRALGNSVVPQCAEVIGNVILEIESRML